MNTIAMAHITISVGPIEMSLKTIYTLLCCGVPDRPIVMRLVQFQTQETAGHNPRH